MTSPTVESYSTDLAILDTANSTGGLSIPFGTYSAAVAYRHRLYRARKAYFKATHAHTYADLFIQLRDAATKELLGAGKHDGPTEILISRNEARQPVEVFDLAGNSITIRPKAPVELLPVGVTPDLIEDEDGLFSAAAAQLLKQLRTETE